MGWWGRLSHKKRTATQFKGGYTVYQCICTEKVVRVISLKDWIVTTFMKLGRNGIAICIIKRRKKLILPTTADPTKLHIIHEF